MAAVIPMIAPARGRVLRIAFKVVHLSMSLLISTPDLSTDSASILAFERSVLFVSDMKTTVNGMIPSVAIVAVQYKVEMFRAIGPVTYFPERIAHAR